MHERASGLGDPPAVPCRRLLVSLYSRQAQGKIGEEKAHAAWITNKTAVHNLDGRAALMEPESRFSDAAHRQRDLSQKFVRHFL
jgi:hypothetical protein